MRHALLALAVVGLGLPLASSPVLAADQKTQTQEQVREKGTTPPPVKQREQVREQIYGSQMMTPQERTAYRSRMRAAKTNEERERIRAEHHAQMQARAKERGITLPDQPPMPGGGMGPGSGMGPGGGMMGPGGGMGSGGGRR